MEGSASTAGVVIGGPWKYGSLMVPQPRRDTLLTLVRPAAANHGRWDVGPSPE
jgi:hypothetical protein